MTGLTQTLQHSKTIILVQLSSSKRYFHMPNGLNAAVPPRGTWMQELLLRPTYVGNRRNKNANTSHPARKVFMTDEDPGSLNKSVYYILLNIITTAGQIFLFFLSQGNNGYKY